MALFTRRSTRSDDNLPPAGWHAAADRPGFYRWWDGAKWTDQYHPLPQEDSPRPVPVTSVTPSSEPRPVPAASTSKAVAPWAKASVWQSAVGESSYPQAFERLVRKNNGHREEWGTELTGLAATVVAEPNNQYDPNAVAVHVQGELVGYLPRDAAQLYSPPLQDLAERGEYLAVEARVWVAPPDDDHRAGSVTVVLPPPHGVQSFNELPEVPHKVLPFGGAIQVSGEDQHMEVLRRYVSDGERYLAVTLHRVEEQKTERSAPYSCVEVRLDGDRVGVLTKAMSEKIADVVQYVTERGKAPVCRAVLKGSPLRAELVLYVAKSHEVTRRWLDTVADEN